MQNTNPPRLPDIQNSRSLIDRQQATLSLVSQGFSKQEIDKLIEKKRHFWRNANGTIGFDNEEDKQTYERVFKRDSLIPRDGVRL